MITGLVSEFRVDADDVELGGRRDVVAHQDVVEGLGITLEHVVVALIGRQSLQQIGQVPFTLFQIRYPPRDFRRPDDPPFLTMRSSSTARASAA